MSAELPLERGLIVERLATDTKIVQEIALKTRGEAIPTSIALGRAFRRIGREFVQDGLKHFSGNNIASSINDIVSDPRLSPQDRMRFSIGFAFGLVGSSASAIYGESYSVSYNEFIVGTPLPSIKEGILTEPEEEAEQTRLRDLQKIYSVTKILGDKNMIPSAAKDHFASMDPGIWNTYSYYLEFWNEAWKAIIGSSPNNIIHNPETPPTQSDHDFFSSLGGDKLAAEMDNILKGLDF